MVMELREFEASNYLVSEADVVAYVNVALEENDPRMCSAVLKDVLESPVMAEIRVRDGEGRAALARLETKIAESQQRVGGRYYPPAGTLNHYCHDVYSG